MKSIKSTVLAVALLVTPTIASASHHHSHAIYSYHTSNYRYQDNWNWGADSTNWHPPRVGYSRHAHTYSRHAAYTGNLSSACRQAASLGGPCGCYAAEHFFGSPKRELWPVSAWLRFPRTSPPSPGAAAIWPGRHVAPVIANNGDGTVTVQDSWATHRVRISGLIFVQPH